MRALLDAAVAAARGRWRTSGWATALLFAARPGVLIERLAGAAGRGSPAAARRPWPSRRTRTPARAVTGTGRPGRAGPGIRPVPLGAVAPEPNLGAGAGAAGLGRGFSGSGVLIGTHRQRHVVAAPRPGRTASGPTPARSPATRRRRQQRLVDDIRGWDFVNDSPDITDFYPHGTQTAGIAVGDGSSGTRLTGVAPGAKLLVCEVNDEDEYWLGQQYCLEHGRGRGHLELQLQVADLAQPDYHMHRQLCDAGAGRRHRARQLDRQPGQLPALLSDPLQHRDAGQLPVALRPSRARQRRSHVGHGLRRVCSCPTRSTSPRAWARPRGTTSRSTTPPTPGRRTPTGSTTPTAASPAADPGLIKPDLMAYTDVRTTARSAPATRSSAALGRDAAPRRRAVPAARRAAGRRSRGTSTAALELTAQDMGDAGQGQPLRRGQAAGLRRRAPPAPARQRR